MVIKMFKPKGIFYEKEIENYELGKYLLKKYKRAVRNFITLVMAYQVGK